MISQTVRTVAACSAALLLTAASEPAYEPGTRLNFIACPLVRDTYIPAWLAQHEGELFYLGPQGDLGTEFYPPQLGHKALVEGVVAQGERVSGGIPLEPVHVSVLPDIDVSCNTILPALDYANPPHHRTPGPSNSVEEEEETHGNSPIDTEAGRQFDVTYAFDVSDRLFLRDTVAVARAASHARETDAPAVEIVGYRAGALLADNERVDERPEIADRRVAMVRRMLVHAGVPEERIASRTVDATGDLDGVEDHKLRIARIIVERQS